MMVVFLINTTKLTVAPAVRRKAQLFSANNAENMRLNEIGSMLGTVNGLPVKAYQNEAFGNEYILRIINYGEFAMINNNVRKTI